MKNFRLPTTESIIRLLLLGCCCLAFSARAQSYSIDWFTIDGGGGTSTNGNFFLSGTIGQPDAGTLTGGGYTVQGGFWGGLAASSSLYLPLVQR